MPGGSARREYERRRARREARWAEQRPRVLTTTAMVVLVSVVVGLTVAVEALFVGIAFSIAYLSKHMLPTRDEQAWAKGVMGERIVGSVLDEVDGVTVLHDRLVPGSRANLDHVAVAASGVWTVDAKNYSGRLQIRNRGRELWINGRNRSKVLDQAERQQRVVQRVLGEAGIAGVPTHAALCFVGVQWPLGARPPTRAREVHVLSPRTLPAALANGGARLSEARVTQIADVLATALKPAILTARPDQSTVEHIEAELTRSCPRCDQPMVARQRRSDGTPFLGCSTFPKCRRTMSLPDESA